MSKYHIYGLGNAMVDTEIEVSDTELDTMGVDKGLMTLVDAQRQSALSDAFSDNLKSARRASGGSVCNSIIASSYFGANTWFSCKVSDDNNGEFYLRDLSEAGVSFDRAKEYPQGETGRCLVLITPDAARSMNTYLGISESLSVDDLSIEALKESDWVYIEGYLVTSPTGKAAAIKLAQLAREHGKRIAISLSDPGIVAYFTEGLNEMIGEGVDMLFCNLDEALQYTNTDNIDDAINALKPIAKEFAVTLGAEGAQVFDGEKIIEIAPHSVDALDTTGAGDMFAGAFLAAIAQGSDHATAGQLASRASGQVVAQFGPRLKAKQHAKLMNELSIRF